MMFIEAAFSPMSESPFRNYTAIAFSILGFWYFIWVVIAAPFRKYFILTPSSITEDSSVDPLRLLIDAIISSAFLIMVFALFYRIVGTIPPGTPLDNIYFSAVTFSTLGFGDIRPHPNAQAFAAIEAIIGNLHLGIIVGSTFAGIAGANKHN